MSTQYDTIGLAYEGLKRLPAAKLERDNFHATVEPFLHEATTRVLDLACGTGYYSRLLLSWGAAAVVGVDISPSMVAAARASLSPAEVDKATFLVGDCSKPLELSGLPPSNRRFDVVTGAWLLNYASSATEMTAMFSNIAANLAPGGHFVGITPHPTNDLALMAQIFSLSWRQRKYGVRVEYVREVEDGYQTHVHVLGRRGEESMTPPSPQISFDSYHFRKDVYEGSARRGGMRGPLEWRSVTLPGAGSEVVNQEDYGVEEYDWDEYLEAPHFGILVIQK